MRIAATAITYRTWLWIFAGVLLLAPDGFALDPPKVVVKYSTECDDGGKLIQIITDTPLGLGNQTFVHCPADDESDAAESLSATPGFFVVEYTADPNTQDIIDGPVELVDTRFDLMFRVFALNGVSTTFSDLSTVLARESHGSLAGELITWDNSVPYQSIRTGSTDCFGNATICSLGAPPGGWPRIESGVPTDRPLPLMQALMISERADFVIGDNLTPDDPTDDILTNMDSQAITYNTWIGSQVERTFVPEPMPSLLLAAGLLGIGALRRIQ